jgi:glycosyltransferase involved in cell wall biosynthesis
MSAEPLVSVMMPCYDVESTLPMAVASLLAQTYSHWEAVVVDDGSTDGTWELLRSVGDARIRLDRFEGNRGRGAARQRCLEMARGELLAFLDADDWMFPDKLEKQVALMRSNPDLAVLSGGCVITDGDGEPVGMTRSGVRQGSSFTRDTMTRPGPPPLSFPPCMVRMSAIGEASFNPDFKRSQDSDFLIQVMLGKPYGVSSDLVYAYSQAEAASLQKTLEGYYYRVRCYHQYSAEFPARARMEMVKTLARIGAYKVAGLLGAEHHLIYLRWQPVTPQAKAAYSDARAAITRTMKNVGVGAC